MSQMLQKFTTTRAAVSSLEYGIIAGVLGIALIGAFHSFGAHLSSMLSGIGHSI